MFRNLRALALLLFLPFLAHAQNGKLMGIITDATTKEPIPFATVVVKAGGQFQGGSTADIDGHYSVSPLRAGTYDVEYSYLGYVKRIEKDVEISVDQTRRVNVALRPKTTEVEGVEIVQFKTPLVNPGTNQYTLSDKDIKHLPTRNVNQIITTQPSIYSNDDGGKLNVRGARDGDNIVYINGVRQIGNAYPPVEAIASLSVITGGVPAQYGDALGGVVSITTKGAAEKYHAGIQYETSSLFDTYNYNLAGANFSGPLIRKPKRDETGEILKDSAGKTVYDHTILGVFTAYTYQYESDAKPSPYGYLKAKSDVQERLINTPLRRYTDEQGNAFYRSEADFLKESDFDRLKARPNSALNSNQFNITFDYQPSRNIIISLGGNADYSYGRNRGAGFTLSNQYNFFNSANNSYGEYLQYNAFLRFRQNFPELGRDSSKGFGLKNFYYQVQADYSRAFGQAQDPNLKERQELYNYWGKFKERRGTVPGPAVVQANQKGQFYVYQPGTSNIIDSFQIGTNADGTLPNNTLYQIRGNTITQGLGGQGGGFEYEPSSAAGTMANINTQILTTEANTGEMNSFFDLPRLGGLINGNFTNIGNGYGNFTWPGQRETGYGWFENQMYRFSGQVAGDLGSHTLKLGFEYEQRINKSYGAGFSPWTAARRLLNSHIISNLNRGTSLSTFSTSYLPSGTRVVTIDPDLPVNTDADGNILNQSAYDKRIRQILGVPNNQLINVEELDPSLANVKNFTVEELLGDGLTPIVGYQGVDPYGQSLKKRPSFYDFFTDTINRPIDAFRPIYTAGYIEDKFEINDLTIRAGIRVDQFDINQPVLKDNYSMTRLTRVGEIDLSKFNSGTFQTPSNIGSDYAIYLDKTADEYQPGQEGNFKIVGFRNGTQFYDATGKELTDYRVIAPDNNVYPLYDLTRLNSQQRSLQRSRGITLDGFQDFKPQTNVLPRLAFSFPINEESVFDAHYDILTQRPLGMAGNSRSGPITFDNYASPLQYYNLSRISGSPFIQNPNLMPQKKIDFQLGFQQALSKNSAIKIAAFYSEVKSLIQIVNVLGGYPNPGYRTNGNIDFGVIKGTTLSYDFRKTKGAGFSANASYTLQFSEGSASDFAQALLNTSTPNLRNIAPQNWDQRHAFKLNLDYHTDEMKNASKLVAAIFKNSGINMTTFLGSGAPYTKDGGPWGGRSQIEGSVNGARLPWTNRTGFRVDKTFEFQGKNSSELHTLNVYVYVQNAFNQINTLEVYRRTGRPDDDGYLSSQFGQNQISQGNIANFSAETYAYYYRQLLLNPDYVSVPRRWRIGVTYSF